MKGGQIMEITLNTDLKYILKNLNLEQKGLLLDKLLEETVSKKDTNVENIYNYILSLQEQKIKLKEKMKKLSILGHQKRWNTPPKNLSNADGMPLACLPHNERKEPKEDNNNLNINIKNNSFQNSNSINSFEITPPKTSEVKEYITQNNFNVDADVFIDFYTSKGWCIGKSEIKNWQAIVRLWHKRASAVSNPKTNTLTEDETYWHELKDKYWSNVELEQSTLTSPKPPPPKSVLINPRHKTEESNTFTYELYPKYSSKFSRFMQLIEENDLNK